MNTINFRFLNKYSDLILQGLGNTLLVTICALFLGFFLGIGIALLRNSKNEILKKVGYVWVDLLRNTPFLAQLFFFYYGLPALGIQTQPLLTGILALSLNSSAPNAEVIRSGLLAVRKDYYEAAYALGYSRIQTFRWIVIPIALRISFRPLTNNMVNLVLGSSAVFAITITDLMGAAKTVSARSARPFEVFLLVLIAYGIITSTISVISKIIYRRIAVKL